MYILQLALQRAGYLYEQPDGIFGQRTLSAVLQFQKENNLKQDGIVGIRTWNALLPYLKDLQEVYGYTNEVDEASLMELAKRLASSYNDLPLGINFELKYIKERNNEKK